MFFDITQLKGKKISVIGGARSGIGVARLLIRSGAKPFVSDSQSKLQLAKSIEEFKRQDIPYETDAHTERVYDCSLMVISPGVPSDAPVVVEAKKRGIRVVSEVETASWFCRTPMVAVTGSNGKTTTTTLVGRILSDAKKEHVVAGNIGEAFSNVVLDVAETSVIVLEISSFQLDFIETFRPSIAILLNITQNHMDRYGNSMDRYTESKARIIMNQQKGDTLVYNADDHRVSGIAGTARGVSIPFSGTHSLETGAFVHNGILSTRLQGKKQDIIAANEISIKGEHNLQNAMAAVLAGRLLGINPASMRATLRNFKGVEHRQEFVREAAGIKYVNDSKATTVESVCYALTAFQEPIVLILGGKDKGNDYSLMIDLVRKKVRGIVAVGISAEKVEKNFTGVVPVVRVSTIGSKKPNIESMARAVEAAAAMAKKGDVVLLSTACASFDWFNDYEERGKIFKQLVMELP
jgi:UDP-N-acetylmuramoylalanine--D-glutamate ligase